MPNDQDIGHRRIGVREFRGNLPSFLKEVRDGASLLITSHDEVVAELHPPAASLRPRRQPGALRGRIHMAADFDALPEDVLAAMEGVRLLLDTHALLWWLADDDRLGRQARDLLADPAQEVLVSVVSLWEIVVKLRVGKLTASLDGIVRAVGKGGFTRLDISVQHLQALAALPNHHRDPFDHLLIAQAIIEEAVFVSDDRHAPLYSVRAITCADPAPAS